MRRAIERLNPAPDYLLIDAVTVDLPLAQRALIHGDALSQCIAAASILAKVERDACMREWDLVFPQYGLKNHKGYSTDEHWKALETHGPTPLHRFSFWPVREHSPHTRVDRLSAPRRSVRWNRDDAAGRPDFEEVSMRPSRACSCPALQSPMKRPTPSNTPGTTSWASSLFIIVCFEVGAFLTRFSLDAAMGQQLGGESCSRWSPRSTGPAPISGAH